MKILFNKKALLFLALLLMFSMITVTEGNSKGDKESEVKISWAEFKKLLNLDANEVSLTWDEFRQLLAQTGEESSISYTVKNGKVILPREQFKQLLDKMKPPGRAILTPPADYIITKAEYQGQIDKKNTTLTALFYLEVFEKEGKGYRDIPFLPQSVALEEVLMDGKPALVLEKSGWYHITTAEKGRHLLKVKYFAPSNLERGGQILNLSIPRTAITLFDLQIPLEKVDIEVPNARELQISQKEGKTRINAVLPATNSIKVLAHRKYVSTKAVSADIPAKIYAEIFNLLSIEEDALRVNSRIKLNVLQNTITHIEARVPDDYTILYIQKADGTRLRDWKTRKTGKDAVVNIPFDNALDGSFVINILTERLFKPGEKETGFNGFQVIGAIRETGYLGAEKKSTAEATPTGVKKLDRLDIKDLPFELVNMSKRPLLFGFRYLRHPYNLIMTITRHEELPSISTVIDMASVITVVLEEGKTLTKAVFTVRNTWKQFLELELPPDSEIWTVYVGGKRENASKSKEGKIMIPLARSEIKGDILQSFTIDLIYYGKNNPLGSIGSHTAHFPLTDIMISKMIWSVYLPQEFRYLHFSGNVEKEEIAKTFNLFLGKTRDFSLDQVEDYNTVAENLERKAQYQKKMSKYEQSLQSNFKNRAIRQQDIAGQLRNEAGLDRIIQGEKRKGLGKPGSGSDILKIELPTSGQIYRFNKTVIEGEPIDLTFYYVSRSIITGIKIAAVLIILLVIYLLRKKIFALIRRIYQWLIQRKVSWNFLKTKAGLRITLFAAAVIFLFISHILFIVFVLLFLLAIFRPNWLLPNIFPKPKTPPGSQKGNTAKETDESKSNKKNDGGAASS